MCITLPWTDSQMPTVEIVSDDKGFTEEQARAFARLIYTANSPTGGLEGVLGGGLLSNGLLDMFTAPGNLMGLPPSQRRSMSTQEGGGGGGTGGSPEAQLESIGAQVFNASKLKDKAHSLPWDFLKGVDKIKEEIEDTVMLQLTHPAHYDDVLSGTRGASAQGHTNRPRAVLFEGPPGCGKTSMARMMASKTQVSMVYLPLEAVVSKWYGEAEQRLAKVLDLTAELGSADGSKGVLLFLDEIEAVAMSRDSEMHEASRRLLSVLLRRCVRVCVRANGRASR